MIQNYIRKVRVVMNSQESKNIFLLSTGNLSNAFVGFLTSIVVLRCLNSEGIALLYPLLGILTVTEQVADLGISTSFIRFSSSLRGGHPAQFFSFCKNFFKIKIFLSLLILFFGQLFASSISQAVFHSDHYTFWVRLTLLIASFSNLSSFHQCYLQVQYRFNSLMISRVFPNLLKIGMIGFLFFFSTLTFETTYSAFALVPIGILVLSIFFSGTDYLKAISTPIINLIEILHFSKWILISVITVALMGQIDVLMLRSIGHPNEVSRLIGGSRIASIFLILSSSLSTVLFPTISAMKTRSEIRTYLKRFQLILPPLLFFLLLSLTFSSLIISILLGSRYIHSVSVFKIFCFQFAMDFFLTPFGLALYNLGKVHILALINLSQLFIIIACNLIFIPSLGADGSALSGLVIRGYATLVILLICKKEKLIGAST